MTISTPAGEVEVRIGDLFEYEGAKVEVVCFSMEHGLVSCRVVSGLLVAQVGGPREGSLIDEEFRPGDLFSCRIDLVARQVLLQSRERPSPRIPTPPARTKARPNKKEKPESQQGTLL